MIWRLRIFGILLLVGCLLPLPGPVAQEEDLPPPINNAHLMVFPAFDELKQKSETLERAEKWSDLIDLYADAWERFPDHVVPVGDGLYIGIREYCTQAIARLPANAIEIYRTKFDPRVRDALETARRTREAADLARTAARYPYSSLIPRCRLLLATIAAEQGNLPKARAEMERFFADNAIAAIVQREPDLVANAAALFACVLAALDDAEALKRLIADVRTSLPQARVLRGDSAESLIDEIQRIAERPPFRADRKNVPEERTSAWPTVAGNPSGTKIAAPSPADPKKIWEMPLYRSIQEGLRLDLTSGVPLTSPHVLRSLRPFFPAIHDGILFVHDGYTLSALNLFADRPSKLWEVKSSVPVSPNTVVDERTIFTVTRHDGRVFANLLASAGETEYKLGGILVSVNFPKRALAAVDAYTGKLLWRLGGSTDPSASFEDLCTFAVAPTPDGPFLYVPAVVQPRPTEPFKHYILCVEAATGRIVWKTFVASGLTEINLFGNSVRDAMGSPVAADEETLYFCSNLGAAAAIEKATGRLKWAYRYEQLPVRPTRTLYIHRNPLEWTNNPPVVARGLFMFTPTDSKNLYALDAKTGALRWLVRREMDQRSIVGISDDRLAVGGETLSLYDLGGGKLLERFAPTRGTGVGRGVVTSAAIIFPTTEGFSILDRRTLRELSWNPWGIVGGGNVTIVDGALALTTADRVIVFYDKDALDRVVRADLLKSPDDPETNFRAAVYTLRAGREENALALFRRVVALTEGKEGEERKRLNAAAKTQIYNLHLRSGEAALFAMKPDEAKRSFRAAAEAATDGPAAAAALLKLCDVLVSRNELAEALAIYQKIVGDYGDLPHEGETLRAVARRAVDDILRRGGRELYAAEDARAAELLRKGKADESLDALREIGDRYPNSIHAPAALAETALLLEKGGKLVEAAAALRRSIRDYPDDDASPESHRRLVLLLERLNQRGPARAILGAMRRKFPDRTVVHEGKKTTARAFAEARLKSDAYRAEAVATPVRVLQPPLVKKWELKNNAFRDGNLLEIVGPLPDEERSTIFLLSSNTLRALNADGSQRWAADLEAIPRFAATYNEILVLGTPRALAAIRMKDGRTAWTYRFPSTAQAFVRMPDVVCVALMDANVSRIVAVDGEKGIELWSQEYTGALYSRLYPADDLLFFYTLIPCGITVLEADSGLKLAVHRIEPQEVGSPLYADDRRLCLFQGGETYNMYEPLTGKLLWSARKTPGSTPRLAQGAGDVFFVVEMAGAKTQLVAVDMATGKRLLAREGPVIASAHAMEIDGDRLYVTGKERPEDRELTLQAFTVKDLQPLWKTRLAIESPAHGIGPGGGAMTKDHYVQFYNLVDNNLRWTAAAVIADKQGKVVQTIRSPAISTRPAVMSVAGGEGMLFIIDDVMEYHGR